MKYIYIQEKKDLNHFFNEVRDEFSEYRIISHDMCVCFELEKRGIEFIDEWSYITDKEINENWNIAYNIAQEWDPSELIQSITGNNNAKSVSKQELVYPLWAALNATTIYSKLIKKYNIKSLKGYFTNTRIPVIRTGPAPASKAVRCVSEAILFYLAEINEISVDSLKNKPKSNLKKLSSLLNTITNINNKNPFQKWAIYNSESNADLIIYEPGLPHSELMAFIKILEDNSKCNLKILVITKNDLCNIRPINLLNTEKLIHSYIYNGINNYNGPFKEIFKNKFLAYQFIAICNEIITSEMISKNYEAILKILNPSLVLFGHDAFTTERLMVRAAQRLNVNSASIMHSGLGYDFGNRGITGEAEKIYVWNNHELQSLLSDNIERCRINVLGALRYYEYIHTPVTNINNSCDKHIDILILTAEVNTGFAAPVANPFLHREALRKLLNLVETKKDLNFVIKPHPSYDYIELYEYFNSLNHKNLKVSSATDNLNELIQHSRIVLMVNYCTTAAINSFNYKVPVILLENAVYDLPRWKNPITNDSVIFIKSIEDLEASIYLLLNNKCASKQVSEAGYLYFKQYIGFDKLKNISNNVFKIVRKESDSNQFDHEKFNLSVSSIDYTLYFYYSLLVISKSSTIRTLKMLYEDFKKMNKCEPKNTDKMLLISAYALGLLSNKGIRFKVYSLFLLIYSTFLKSNRHISRKFFLRNYMKALYFKSLTN